MSITRTINYTQNIPVTLGFTNYISETVSRNIEVKFEFTTPNSDAKMGVIYFDDVTGVTQTYDGNTIDENIFGTISITGPVADVNIALNSAMFQNHFYDCENISQNFLSLNRILPNDFRGEMQIQINPDVVHGLGLGDACCISSVGIVPESTRYYVTAIDSTNSPTRIWLIYSGGYLESDKYFSSAYKDPAIGNYLQTGTGTNIAPIIDISYNNPHGFLNVITTITDLDTSTIEETGVLEVYGSFFINEPEFTTLPPTSISAATPNTWTNNLGMGAIAQSEDNYQSIQYLIKYLENDPMYLGVAAYTSLPGYPSSGTVDAQLAFIGAAIDTKAGLDTAVYVTNDTYGMFGTTQVGNRISESYSTDEVRWSFYGTPTECNDALRTSSYFRPPILTKDFSVETRIVNGRTRIYSKRGK